MKALVLAIATCLALAVGAGCGSSGDDASSASTESNAASSESNAAGQGEGPQPGSAPGEIQSGTRAGYLSSNGTGVAVSDPTRGAKPTRVTVDKTRPTITAPQGPPPKKLIVKDLEEGTGPPAKHGDELTIMYAGRYYRSGKPYAASWDWGKPVTFKLGAGQYDSGWETGLPGMRVGGRRELIVPAGFEGRTGVKSKVEKNFIYVIDLFAIN